MDDLERYGDYNDTDDDIPKKKSVVGLVIKILIAVVCVTVIGILLFRVILFNSYPEKMKRLYFNDTLTEYYNATGGKIGAKTQTLLARYDDEEEGNFFYDYMVFIPEINQIQFTIKFNESTLDRIASKYKKKLKGDPKDLFSFSLVRNPTDEVPEGEEVVGEPIGNLSYISTDKVLMYRYVKLVFDNVDLGLDEGENPVNWIRVEIKINEIPEAETYKIAIYSNSTEYEYAKTEDYKLSKKERPKK